jgi:hypothetical protein
MKKNSTWVNFYFRPFYGIRSKRYSMEYETKYIVAHIKTIDYENEQTKPVAFIVPVMRVMQ